MFVRPLFLILLLFFLQSQDCKKTVSNNSVNQKQKESKVNQEFNPKVEEWVNEAPFDDPLKQQQTPSFSYEDWFKRGRALPSVNETLINLLQKEDLEKPSGNGMRVAYALGWVGDKRKQIVEILLRAINSKDLSLRIEAVSALGRQGDAAVLPTLEKLLTNKQENSNVRGNACISIGRLGVPSSDKLLTDALNDSDPFIVSCAKEGLRLFREKNSPQS
jgi:HEAT repeats